MDLRQATDMVRTIVERQVLQKSGNAQILIFWQFVSPTEMCVVIICKLEYFTSFSKHAEEHFQWIEKWPKKEKKKT